MYTSKILDTGDEDNKPLWPYGFCTIGDVTFESAAYVARYLMKKVYGEMAPYHYENINVDTGEVTVRVSEYTTMSRRPGIGKSWFEHYSEDVYPDDFVVVNGKKVRPPKYYDELLERFNADLIVSIKEDRKRKAVSYESNNTEERLRVREEVQKRKLELLKRSC